MSLRAGNLACPRPLTRKASRILPVSRLFNAYVMVLWSAAAAPKTGKDSIWIGVFKRDVRFRLAFEAHNPATRADAAKMLDAIFAELRRKGERTLVGFDFPFGLPRGAVEAAKLKPADWSGLWAFLAKDLVDKPTNVNNRFGVANKLNRLMTDKATPFWGAPPKDVQTWLSATRPADAGPFPALRHADKAVGAKSVWQLSGAGAAGGHALTGIARLKPLVETFGDKAKVWPFQTGWKSLVEADVEGLEAVFVEIYPGLVAAKPEAGEQPDRAQARALCEHFARLDEGGKLGAVFGPKDADEAVRAEVEREEGWILGAG